MDDTREPQPEVTDFLRARAAELDRGAAPIGAEEARDHRLTKSLEPNRWKVGGVSVTANRRRRPAIAAAVVAALLIGSVVGFAAGRSSSPKSEASLAAHGAAQDTTTPTVIDGQAEAVSSGG